MSTAIARKPKAAKQTPRTIVRREETSNVILYYILQGDHLHEVTIENGVASCNCHAYLYSAKGNKRCGDTDLATKNESERATDIQQHVRDGLPVYSCPGCGHPMTADVYCYNCCN